MRRSKLVQQKFSKISEQLGIKNLEFLNYRYGLLINENLSVVVANVRSKFEQFEAR
jgi:hypothetical protein